VKRFNSTLRLGPRKLSVSSNGSTWVKRGIEEMKDKVSLTTFSILERIDVGETCGARFGEDFFDDLSVSSNGSTWVKLSQEDKK